MKKSKILIATLVVALFTCFHANAVGLRFGLKAGLNVDEMKLNKDVFDSSNRCGFTVGPTMELGLPLGFNVDLSVMYSRMYSKVGVDMSDLPGGDDETVSKTEGRNYIEIPLNVKYKLSLPAVERIISPYVYTGPTLAVRVGGDEDYLKTKSCQWGWNLGLGVELIKHLQVTAGYTWGMNNVAKHIDALDSFGEVSKLKVKNNYWTVTVGWMF